MSVSVSVSGYSAWRKKSKPNRTGQPGDLAYRRLLIVSQAAVRRSADIESQQCGRLKPDEVATALEEQDFQGHRRVRIGQDLWISTAIDTTKSELLKNTEVVAEDISDELFFERIKSADRINNIHATFWLGVSLMLLGFGALRHVDRDFEGLGAFGFLLSLGSVPVFLLMSKCCFNKHFRLLKNARNNGLENKLGKRNKWATKNGQSENCLRMITRGSPSPFICFALFVALPMSVGVNYWVYWQCASLSCSECSGDCGWCSSRGGVCGSGCTTSPGECAPSGSSQCPGSGTLTSPGGFDDGSGSTNYQNNLNCQWTLVCQGQQRVTLELNSVDVESCCDHVRVDGNTITGSSYSYLQSYEDRYNDVVVTFTSDGSVTRAGWQAIWGCN